MPHQTVFLSTKTVSIYVRRMFWHEIKTRFAFFFILLLNLREYMSVEILDLYEVWILLDKQIKKKETVTPENLSYIIFIQS